MGKIYSIYVLVDRDEKDLSPDNLSFIDEIKTDEAPAEGEEITLKISVNGRRADSTTHFKVVSVDNTVRPRKIIVNWFGDSSVQ